MNKYRREELLDVAQLLDEAIDRLNEIRDDEQDSFDSLPEGLQCSSRGEAMEDAMATMDEWEDEIDSIRSKIEDYAAPPKKSKKK